MPAPAPSPELQAALYSRSGAARYGLSAADFSSILLEVAAKNLAAGCTARRAAEFFESLRVEELALARGCAAGNEKAWEEFLTRFRSSLYGAAYSIAREESAARDLADSLYAELYGMRTKGDGHARVSKLSFYTGRGSLEGWLRTVLAQEFVNRYRRTRREVSLDEESEDGVQFAAPQAEPATAADPRLEAATDAALAALPAEERYILAAYFLDGRTLAEIAKTLGLHESTISRKLEKTAKGLRRDILTLLERAGMSPRQAEEALSADVRDLAVNVRERLRPPQGGELAGPGLRVQESRAATFSQEEGKK